MNLLRGRKQRGETNNRSSLLPLLLPLLLTLFFLLFWSLNHYTHQILHFFLIIPLQIHHLSILFPTLFTSLLYWLQQPWCLPTERWLCTVSIPFSLTITARKPLPLRSMAVNSNLLFLSLFSCTIMYWDFFVCMFRFWGLIASLVLLTDFDVVSGLVSILWSFLVFYFRVLF